MSPEKIEQERKAFEEWYCSKTSESIGLKHYPNGRFRNPETENMYLAWCAAKSHAEQSEWISVQDRLPEIDTTVLVCTERGYIFTSWASDVDVFWFYGEEEDDRVTHWQPLPAPPTTNPAA